MFSDESADWSELEAVEAGFYSVEEAQDAIKSRYHVEDNLCIHVIEQPDEDEE